MHGRGAMREPRGAESLYGETERRDPTTPLIVLACREGVGPVI